MVVSRRIVLMLAFTTVLGGCASTGGRSNTSGNRNVLTLEELVDTNAASIYDAIQRLRPRWLRPRGFTSTGANEGVPVYRDGVRVGGLSYLHSVQVNAVIEVHYVSASDATTRWGTGNASGAIELITR